MDDPGKVLRGCGCAYISGQDVSAQTFGVIEARLAIVLELNAERTNLAFKVVRCTVEQINSDLVATVNVFEDIARIQA